MSNKRKNRGTPIDGMLLLDKPAGVSSNHALQQAKRLLDARKAGHTGSLDPIATGLLPLTFGVTTRIAELFLDADKSYAVEIKLGIATETGDREGKVLSERKVDFTEAELHAALNKFRGKHQQIPPMFSALKKDGQPLYKLARQGITVKREPREVTVYEMQIADWQGDKLELTLTCSRGFYVRTLAADLGEALGCGGHVTELRRTAVGHLVIANATTIPQLQAATPTARQNFLTTNRPSPDAPPRNNPPRQPRPPPKTKHPNPPPKKTHPRQSKNLRRNRRLHSNSRNNKRRKTRSNKIV